MERYEEAPRKGSRRPAALDGERGTTEIGGPSVMPPRLSNPVPMPPLAPQDPDFERRVRESFARQAVMHTLGARLLRVAPGETEIDLAIRPELGQQNGFLHAGIVATLLAARAATRRTR